MNRMEELGQRDLAHIWHPCSQMKDYETLRPIVVDRLTGSYLYLMTVKILGHHQRGGATC